MMSGLYGSALIKGAINELKTGKRTRFDPELTDLYIELLETQENIW